MADTVPLVPENPKDASNRRISVSVQYQKIDAPVPARTEPTLPAMQADEKLYKASIDPPATSADDVIVQRVAQNIEPTAAPLKDDVFLNLRNALR